MPLEAGTPEITVVLPVFNGARYLAEAIESVLSQSHGDLQLWIADGGSSDATRGIAEAYANLDPRVRVMQFPDVPPTRRVDLCIAQITSPFIALQHADDISYRDRLALQLQAFQQDASLGICSAAYRSFWHLRSCSGQEGVSDHAKPCTHEEIHCQLLFWWVMHAPTFMFRRSHAQAAGLRFANEFVYVNDYWQTVTYIDKLRYFNLPQVLSAYRLHLDSDGPRNLEQVKAEQTRVRHRTLQHFGFTASARETQLHEAIQLFPDHVLALNSLSEYDEMLDWLESLYRQNAVLGVFDSTVFRSTIDHLQSETALLKKQRAAREASLMPL